MKMSLNLCSSSSETTVCCFKELRHVAEDLASRRICYPCRKESIRVPCISSRKVLISGSLIPEQLNGAYVRKKKFQEVVPKLGLVRTLLIDNYDSYTYNIYQELSVVNKLPPVVIRNDEWSLDELLYHIYEEKAFDNIVISPGPGSPTCPADIGFAYVHGGHIVHAPEPVHGRLSEIEHSGCPLFNDVPSGRNSSFKVVRYHSLVIDAESLPKDIIPIAWASTSETHPFIESSSSVVIPSVNGSTKSRHPHVNGFPAMHTTENFLSTINADEQRKIIMGIMHSISPHYGLQFHPESVATYHGRQIFKNFRDITLDYWSRARTPYPNWEIDYGTEQVFHGNPHFSEILGRNDLANSAKEWNYRVANSLGSMHPRITKSLKLRWRKLNNLLSKVGGTKSIFCELFGTDKANNTFWLDSSSVEKKRARFSFMGGQGGSLWKQLSYRLTDDSTKSGGHLLIEDAVGSTSNIYLQDGFFDFLNNELQSLQYDEKDYEGLPFDFHGGYVGYIGYNLKLECGIASNRHKSETPDACFFFADKLVVVDHYHDDVYILSIDENSSTNTSWLDDIERKLLCLEATAETDKNQSPRLATLSPIEAGFIAEKSRDQYTKDVDCCMKYITDGESYELCYTTQLKKHLGNIDMLRLYLNLRERNPSPYAAWLNFTKENLSICCSSPERFLRLNRYGELEAKPIKGTIARGGTPTEDEQLKIQLQHSEKDQAENLMIVDLLRNDLGQVCEPGSVHVPNLMDVESYATVHTMVSTIRGKKLSDVSPVDCVRAAFPGGSMTGAPKLRSMEILDSLEGSARGIYSGSIGFFSLNQTFDLNIVIRTIVLHNGEASIGAGGAIVSLSNPESEYEEMLLKARAPANVVLECQRAGQKSDTPPQS